MPGSCIVVAAVHLALLDRLLCFNFPVYIRAFSMHCATCSLQLPSGVSITPRVRLPVVGEILSIVDGCEVVESLITMVPGVDGVVLYCIELVE